MLPRFVPSALFCAGLCVLSIDARGEEDEETPGPDEQQLTEFLAQKPASADVSRPPEAPEAPPPPPRKHGFVLESSIGAQGQLGALSHVSPTAPWFHTAFGWEPTHWFMVLAQFDASIANTSLANPPPGERGYALLAFGGAGRFGIEPARNLGFYAQGEVGLADVTTEVLATYGYKDADSLGLYAGGMLGVEWYQVNPHYALALQGGARWYSNLDRSIGGDTAIALLGAAALRYTF
jgi:hypothetical protein